MRKGIGQAVDTGPDVQRIRRYFHVSLGAIFLPILSVPLLWHFVIQAKSCRRKDSLGFNLLFSLTVLDSVVAIILLAVILGIFSLPSPGSEPRPRYRLGVELDPDYIDEVRITRVLPNSPAEKAMLQIGDGILSLDGRPLMNIKGLRKALEKEKEAGLGHTLRVRRDGKVITVIVASEEIHDDVKRRRGFYEVWPGDFPICRVLMIYFGIFLPALILLVTLWGWCRTRHIEKNASLLWTVAILAGGATVCLLLSTLLVYMLGGRSDASYVFGTLAYPLVMIVLASMIMRKIISPLHADSLGTPFLSTSATVARGVWYLVTIVPRICLVILTLTSVLSVFAERVSRWGSAALTYDLSQRSYLSAWLLGIGIIVLTPIAEEMTFRGIMLPSLRKPMRDSSAVLFTAAAFGLMHFSYGWYMLLVFFYGIVLGWARIRSGGLLAPIILHMIINILPALRLLGNI